MRYIRSLFLCGKVEELHLDEHSFDKVCSFCVIEHIPNHMDVLRELHRLLVPGGELILSADSLETINDPGLLAKHRKENRVVTYFREDTLRQALEESGFRDIKIRPIFRSEFSHRKFCSMIRNMGRRRSYVGSLIEYLWLRFQERWTRNKERGIFLVARCRK